MANPKDALSPLQRKRAFHYEMLHAIMAKFQIMHGLLVGTGSLEL